MSVSPCCLPAELKSCRASDAHTSGFRGRVFFEKAEAQRAAVKAGLIDAALSAAIGDEFARVEAPQLPENLSKPLSFIFWTMDGPDDVTPTWEKVVSTLLPLFYYPQLTFLLVCWSLLQPAHGRLNGLG